MASTVLFMVMYLLASLFLLISSILATIATVQAGSSLLYTTNSKIKSAQQWLLVSTIISWVALVLLAIILVITIFAGGLPTVEISEKFKSKSTLSKREANDISQAKNQLLSNSTTKKIVAIFIIVSILLILLSFIFNIIALANLSQPRKDANANKAYTKSIVNLVLGVLQLGFLMIAVFGYSSILASSRHQLKLASAKIPDTIPDTDDENDLQ